MVENQNFAATDNTARQATQPVGDSGISGQSRMELYEDYSKTVANTAPGEKSQGEQTEQGSKSEGSGQDLSFDNIFDKTTSPGGTKGERKPGDPSSDGSTNGGAERTQPGGDARQPEQGPEGRSPVGPESSQNPQSDGQHGSERTQSGISDAQGREQGPEDDRPTSPAGPENSSERDHGSRADHPPEAGHKPDRPGQAEHERSHSDGQSQEPGSPGEFNGRTDPYTKDALEGRAANTPDGGGERPGAPNGDSPRQGNASPETTGGERPGAPNGDSPRQGNASPETTGGERPDAPQGDLQRQGTEGQEGGGAAQLQGNADAQRQSAGSDRPQAGGMNSLPGQESRRTESPTGPNDLAHTNQAMMSAESSESPGPQKDFPGQPSEQNPNQRSDARDSVEQDLSRLSGNKASAQETVEDSHEPGEPDSPEGEKPGPEQPESANKRNSLSDLSIQNANQMMSASETIDESDEPGSPGPNHDQGSTVQTRDQPATENSRNSLSDLSAMNANQTMSASEAADETDEPNAPSTESQNERQAAGGAGSERQGPTQRPSGEGDHETPAEQRQEDPSSKSSQQAGPKQPLSQNSFMNEQTKRYLEQTTGSFAKSLIDSQLATGAAE